MIPQKNRHRTAEQRTVRSCFHQDSPSSVVPPDVRPYVLVRLFFKAAGVEELVELREEHIMTDDDGMIDAVDELVDGAGRPPTVHRLSRLARIRRLGQWRGPSPEHPEEQLPSYSDSSQTLASGRTVVAVSLAVAVVRSGQLIVITLGFSDLHVSECYWARVVLS